MKMDNVEGITFITFGIIIFFWNINKDIILLKCYLICSPIKLSSLQNFTFLQPIPIPNQNTSPFPNKQSPNLDSSVAPIEDRCRRLPTSEPVRDVVGMACAHAARQGVRAACAPVHARTHARAPCAPVGAHRTGTLALAVVCLAWPPPIKNI